MRGAEHDALPRGRASLAGLLVRGHPRSTAIAVVAGVLSGLAGIAAIDQISAALSAGPSPHDWQVFAAIALALVSTRFVAATLPAHTAQEVVASLRKALSRRVLAAPLAQIEATGASSILTLLTKDIPALAEALMLLPTVLVALTVLTFGLGYIGWRSPVALAVVAGCVAAGLSCYALLYRHGMAYYRRNRDEHAKLNEHMHATVFGIKELKLNRARRRWFRRATLDLSVRRVAAFEFIGRLHFIAGENLGQLMFFAMMGTLAFAGRSMTGLDAAALSACVFAVLYCLEPLFTLVSLVPLIGEGAIALERLNAFGVTPPAKGDAQAGTTMPLRQCLRLRAVEMRYAATGFRLGPIDLALRPGELVFVVGGNGGGKSTLIKILTGLYRPTTGDLTVDGVPIVEANLEAYRSLFSVVFADFHVFPHLVGAADTRTAMQRAQQHLATLKLNGKVQIEDGTLSTTTLSQGERKRLALLAAYLEDRPIVVLDEWAADQDPAFREFFYRVLLPELKGRGKCVVAITHDDRYFDIADRVVRVDDGRIVSDLARQRLEPQHLAASLP